MIPPLIISTRFPPAVVAGGVSETMRRSASRCLMVPTRTSSSSTAVTATTTTTGVDNTGDCYSVSFCLAASTHPLPPQHQRQHTPIQQQHQQKQQQQRLMEDGKDEKPICPKQSLFSSVRSWNGIVSSGRDYPSRSMYSHRVTLQPSSSRIFSIPNATTSSSSSSSSSIFNYTFSPYSSCMSGHHFNRLFSSKSNGGSGPKKRDLYEVLGVSSSASKADIKKSFYQLAKKYHPDTNQLDKGAEEKFKEVTNAYEVLSDDEMRQRYDQFGWAGIDPSMGGSDGPPGGFDGTGFNFSDGSFHFSTSSSGGGNLEIDPEELFDMFFGGNSGGNGRRKNRKRGPRRGSDLQTQVRLTFREAVMGCQKNVNVRYQVMDNHGQVSVKERSVTVDTPAGIDTGISLRLQGQGAEGDPGAPKGNLLVQVVVEPDEYFRRDGSDVHVEVPISFTKAILGGSVDVKTLAGDVEMKIPKGCQPETKLFMKNKGIQRLHGSGKGNQIVHLKIEFPKEITARQEELLREFDGQEVARHGGGGDDDGKEGSGCGEGPLSGRIVQETKSAFEKLFGKKTNSNNNNSNNKKNNNKNGEANVNNNAEDDEMKEEEEEKKQAAQ